MKKLYTYIRNINPFKFMMESMVILAILSCMWCVYMFTKLFDQINFDLSEISEVQYTELKQQCINASIQDKYNKFLESNAQITNEEMKMLQQMIDSKNKISKHRINTEPTGN